MKHKQLIQLKRILASLKMEVNAKSINFKILPILKV